MLNDILTFAARTLVTDGRLSMWMPTANDEVELVVPMHPNLELVSVSVQSFGNCKFSISFLQLNLWVIVIICGLTFNRVSSTYDLSPAARRTVF